MLYDTSYIRLIRSWPRLYLFVGLAVVSSACGGPRVQVSHPAIPVGDSIRLAADVVLPVDRPSEGVPTVLIQTRYWRSFRMRGGGGPRIPQGPREPIVQRLVSAGMAAVIVDVRGTGASDGVWRWPWSAEEVRDMGPLIDWIVAQPWSNGIVGATGVSYEGTTALLAATSNRSALKAVLARQIEWALADETLAPGGVRNQLFPDVWGRTVDDLDHGRYPAMFPGYARWLVTGVARRDDDRDGRAQMARQQARGSSAVAERARMVRRGDDHFGADGPPTDSMGPAGHIAALRQTQAVVGLWGSWWDGGTADAVMRARENMPIVDARIGPWNHEGTENASPLQLGNSAHATVELDSVVAFFRRHLRGAAADRTSRVSWYVAGEERWRSASTWPTTTPRTWLLSAALRQDSSSSARTNAATSRDAIAHGRDTVLTWTSPRTASTGTNTRWTTGLARSVDVHDRARAKGLWSLVLPRESAPLSVFGAGQFTCLLQPDQPEAALHVYVEGVSPDGTVRLLTEGMQRVFRTDDRAVPSTRVTVRIRPVAFALPASWRLRVSLASEDAPTFETVSPATRVTWTMHTRECQLVLPTEGLEVTAPPASP